MITELLYQKYTYKVIKKKQSNFYESSPTNLWFDEKGDALKILNAYDSSLSIILIRPRIEDGLVTQGNETFDDRHTFLWAHTALDVSRND